MDCCDNIDPKSFEFCGEEMYDNSIQSTYQTIQQQMLRRSLLRLETERDEMDDTIYEITDCLLELNNKRKLYSTHANNLFTGIYNYNSPLRQIIKQIAVLEKQLQQSQHIRSIISVDIEIIMSQLSAFCDDDISW